MPDSQSELTDSTLQRAPDGHDGQSGGGQHELALGVLLAVAVFVFHYLLERRLMAMGAFALFDTLFDADPGLTLEAISSGGGGNHLAHPLLEHIFSGPIGLIARLGSLLSSGALTEGATRISLALLVVPIATGLQTFVALRVLRQLGLSLRSAMLLVVLLAVSFSRLLLGSMPESYVLSALCISLAYMLFLRTRGQRGWRAELSWIALGVLTAGVTITNAAAVAILYFARELNLGRGFWRGGLRTTLTIVIILVVTLTSGIMLDVLSDAREGKTPNEVMWISRYFVDAPVTQLVTFPTAVTNGLAPPVPESMGNIFAVRAQKAALKRGETPDQPILSSRLTLRGTHEPTSVRNLIGYALLAALAWVALRDRRLETPFKALARASLAIVAFNWILHGFWGGEQFLYSQHWHMSLLVLMGAAVAALEVRGRNTILPLSIGVLGIAVSNSIVLMRTLQTLLEG